MGFRWGCLPARRSSCDKLRTNGYHAGLLCRCHPSARRHSRRPTLSSFPRKRESTPQSPTPPPKAATRPIRHSGAGRNPEPRPPLAERWGGIAASVHPELVAGRTDAGRLGWLGFRWGCLPARRSSCDKLRTNGYHAGRLCRCRPSAHRQPRRPTVIPAKAGIHPLKARLHPLKGRRPPPPSFPRKRESTP